MAFAPRHPLLALPSSTGVFLVAPAVTPCDRMPGAVDHCLRRSSGGPAGRPYSSVSSGPRGSRHRDGSSRLPAPDVAPRGFCYWSFRLVQAGGVDRRIGAGAPNDREEARP